MFCCSAHYLVMKWLHTLNNNLSLKLSPANFMYARVRGSFRFLSSWGQLWVNAVLLTPIQLFRYHVLDDTTLPNPVFYSPDFFSPKFDRSRVSYSIKYLSPHLISPRYQILMEDTFMEDLEGGEKQPIMCRVERTQQELTRWIYNGVTAN